MKIVMYALLCAVAGARLGTKTAITNEYVALAPCGGGGTNTTIEWVKVRYCALPAHHHAFVPLAKT